jgi:predicted glycoside hydrolase/deacetylase ChbG (UPF0249 family)
MFAEKTPKPSSHHPGTSGNLAKLQKSVITLARIAAAIILPLYAYKVWLKTDYTDFEVYYRSAVRAAQGNWEEVYSLKDGASPFRYAPPTIPFFRPFAELSLSSAKLVWYFLQYLWFGLGFYFIHRSLQRISRPRSSAAFPTAFALLFIVRFCLDCFTIGQVSSLLFLSFCASFYYWVTWQSGRASTALLIPTLVKIGPGFLYPLFLHGRPKAKLRAVLAPLFTLIATLVLTTLWIGPWDRVKMLWSRWSLMVTEDSQYYDASHYGSQSIKSALLRMVNWHWLSPAVAMNLYATLGVLICGSVLLFWLFRFPRRTMGRAAAFALGIFPYLWVMPETFKYSLTVLAIPVALLVSEQVQTPPERKCRFTLFALIFGTLTLSLAGKDLIGSFLFFGSQKASLPLLATIFLGIATALLAYRHSRPSWLAREVQSLVRSKHVLPWEQEPQDATLDFSLLAPIPMQSATSINAEAIVQFIKEAQALFDRISQNYEILIQPYGDRLSEQNPAWAELRKLEAQSPRIKLLNLKNPAEHFPTRNAALRESFALSRGKVILTAQLEQPCDPVFYQKALQEIAAGCSLVRGNRRHPESRFRIPVRLLPIVYQRHRLGLRFNKLVRALLPIETTDTHSGTLAMIRPFALQAFTLQSSLGFLFDLELAIIAKTHSHREKDLPVTLILAEEKSMRRISFEALSILWGLPKLAKRYRAGFYSPLSLTQAFTADDWGLTPEVNLGILDLVRTGVIKRISIMARSAHITLGLNELLQVIQTRPDVELGLHFDLTYGICSPGKVLLQWMSPFSDKEALRSHARSEFQAQISKLKSLQIPIHYIDGHHHIHLSPGLIDAISDLIQAEGITCIRCPYDPSLWLTPKAVLNLLSLWASRRLKALGFRSLPCFYPQNSHFLDPGKFRAALIKNPESEIIVHPARRNDLTELSIPDPYTEGRVLEYRVLRMLRPLNGKMTGAIT